MRRAILLSLLLSCGAIGCAPTAPSPARLAALAEALSAEDYADTFLHELEARLDAADLDLTREQHGALRPVLVHGAESQRTLIAANARTPSATFAADSQRLTAQTDDAARAILTQPQEPVYARLRAEAREIIRRQIEG